MRPGYSESLWRRQDTMTLLERRGEPFGEKTITKPDLDSIEWLAWVAKESSTFQPRLFCRALWALWTDRNKRVHARNAAGEVLVSRSILHDDIGFVSAAKALAFSWAVQTGVEMALPSFAARKMGDEWLRELD
ncbi:hypothetical protein PVK06_012814 [Gossypium arboreum]|uniref:Uncharacterized protein n=1 Tax=Gossypium arboreum TaxID=29729 RepID=A0ABR0QDU1_GOSAR|nr:hypothetical protein PVK06_012814 [Gossypium arboreum]